MRKAAAFVLIFALMSGLCACGGGSGTSAEAPEQFVEGGAYALKRLELTGSAMQLVSDGERAYVLTSGYHLYALTDGEAVELDFNLSERLPCRMAADAAGLKLVTCDEGGENYELLTLDADGGVSEVQALPGLLSCVGLACLDGAAYVYDYTAGLLCVFGGDGGRQAGIGLDGATVTGLAAGPGGLFAALRASDGTETLSRLEDGVLAGGQAISGSIWPSQRFDCLLSDKLGLYGRTGGSCEPLVIWVECGLSFSELSALAELGDGFALINADVLYLLEPADASDIPARRELGVYCLDPGMDDFLDLILSELNLTEPNIFARTLHDGEADGQARLSALSTLLASGKGPDLVCFGSLDPSAYTGSGWFLDIYGLIDADPDFDRDELVAAAAYETDTGLFAIPTAFGVSTLLGRESRFEGRYALDATVSDELEAEQMLYQGGLKSLIASALAAQLIKGELPGQERLTALLELSAASENRAEYLPLPESLGKDRVLLEYQYLYSANTFAECEAAAGCGLWPAGIPTFDGSCGSLASSLLCWGACTDGGWELLKALLRLPGANLFNEAFMYRPLFEQQLEQSKADERQREIFRGLVESLRLADYSSGELRSIVQEEMGAGAAPEQTARTMLDRASLLIAERG